MVCQSEEMKLTEDLNRKILEQSPYSDCRGHEGYKKVAKTLDLNLSQMMYWLYFDLKRAGLRATKLAEQLCRIENQKDAKQFHNHIISFTNEVNEIKSEYERALSKE